MCLCQQFESFDHTENVRIPPSPELKVIFCPVCVCVCVSVFHAYVFTCESMQMVLHLYVEATSQHGVISTIVSLFFETGSL